DPDAPEGHLYSRSEPGRLRESCLDAVGVPEDVWPDDVDRRPGGQHDEQEGEGGEVQVDPAGQHLQHPVEELGEQAGGVGDVDGVGVAEEDEGVQPGLDQHLAVGLDGREYLVEEHDVVEQAADRLAAGGEGDECLCGGDGAVAVGGDGAGGAVEGVDEGDEVVGVGGELGADGAEGVDGADEGVLLGPEGGDDVAGLGDQLVGLLAAVTDGPVACVDRRGEGVGVEGSDHGAGAGGQFLELELAGGVGDLVAVAQQGALTGNEGLREDQFDEVFAEQRGAADDGPGADGDLPVGVDVEAGTGLVAVELEVPDTADHDIG